MLLTRDSFWMERHIQTESEGMENDTLHRVKEKAGVATLIRQNRH